MKLEDIKTLAAAALLGRSPCLSGHSNEEIEQAVRTAQKIWEEVWRQERER